MPDAISPSQTQSAPAAVNGFRRSVAVVIGINGYNNGIPPLRTAVNDATRLARILENEHGYRVHLLAEEVGKAKLKTFFDQELPGTIDDGDRLLVYFAGHGVALDGEDGPAGYLIPQDARPDEADSFLSMAALYEALATLPCRHLLVVLDCCFAGAFKWASTRAIRALPEVVYKERYDRYIQDPAWQVITSAAYDQEALDVLAGDVLGVREDNGRDHSPFAQALFAALQGEGDLIPKDQGDGVITAAELYLYLRQFVEVRTGEGRQTPGLWPLPKHDKGEYIFLVPGWGELDLPPAEPLRLDNNPYKGLNPYDFNREDARLFFGRRDLELTLARRVAARPLTVVLGASGTGKSSLVKAGLLPRLAGWRQETDPLRSLDLDPVPAPAERPGEPGPSLADHRWHILPPMRPTAHPLRTLQNLLHQNLALESDRQAEPFAAFGADWSAARIEHWLAAHPDRTLLLVVDQFEELVTLCPPAERETFLELLARLRVAHPQRLRLVLTLRSDFEPQFAESTLHRDWSSARFVVPPMDQDDLRRAIEGPAAERVLYFEPPELVERLINEVIQTPGGLPLLSFTLSELYIKHVRSGSDDRALTEQHYDELGGVIGALRVRAEEEYAHLPDQAHRRTMQRMLLRMVAVEGGELARRRVERSELVYASEEENQRVREVLGRLVAARLLVSGRDDAGDDYVEPAHDALIQAWNRLLRWKQEAELYLPLQRRVAQAATDWAQAGAPEQERLLWNGNAFLPQLRQELTLGSDDPGARAGGNLLSSAWELLWPSLGPNHPDTWLNRQESAFVRASVQRQARLNRRLTAITIAVILVLSATTAYALNRQDLAEKRSDEAVAAQETAVTEARVRATAESLALTREAEAVAAEATAEAEAYNARRSLSGQLALRSDAERELAPQRSLLVAVEALRVTQEQSEPPVAAAETALRQSLEAVQGRALTAFEGNVCTLAVSPDATRLALADCDNGLTAQVWDLAAPNPTPTALFDPGGEVSGATQTVQEEPFSVFDGIGHFSADGRWFVMPNYRELPQPEGGSAFLLWDLAQAAGAAGPFVLSTPSGFYAEPIEPDIDPFAVAFSADGRRLLVGGADGQIARWDLQQPQQTAETVALQGIAGAVLALGFDLSDRWLAIVAADLPSYRGATVTRSVYLLPAADLALAETVPIRLADNQPFSAAAWVPQLPHFGFAPAVLFTGTDGGRLERWSLAGEEPASTLLWEADRPITQLLVDASGHWLLAAAADFERSEVGLWHLGDAAGRRLTLPTPEGQVLAAVAHPKLSLLAYSDEDQTYVVDLETNESEPVVQPVMHPVNVLRFSQDGSYLVGSAYGNQIVVWRRDDAGRFERSHLLPGQEAPSSFLAVGPTGQRIAAVTDGFSTSRLWALDQLGARDPRISLGDAWAVAVSADERWLMAVQDDQLVAWDLLDAVLPPARHVLLDGVGMAGELALAVSPAQDQIAIGDSNGQIRLWPLDSQSMDLVGEAETRQVATPVDHLRFDPMGRRLLAASIEEWEGTVAVWDLADGVARPVILQGEPGRVLVLTVSPDGRWVGALLAGDLLNLWALPPDGPPQAQPMVIPARDFAFSPDGRQLAVGDGSSIRLYDLDLLAAGSSDDASAPPSARLADGQSEPASIAFSGDGAYLYALPERGNLARWALGGTEPARLDDLSGENADRLRWLYVGQRSGWIVAAEQDGPYRLWPVAAPGETPPARHIEAVAFGRPLVVSPDGHRLVTLDQGAVYPVYQGPLYLWRLDIDGLLALACEKVGRNFSESEWRTVFGQTTYRKTCVE